MTEFQTGDNVPISRQKLSPEVKLTLIREFVDGIVEDRYHIGEKTRGERLFDTFLIGAARCLGWVTGALIFILAYKFGHGLLH